jgi:hypothetical protein
MPYEGKRPRTVAREPERETGDGAAVCRVRKTTASKAVVAKGSALISIDDIQAELGCGRNAAYSVARRIGRRLTERRGRLLVTRRALQRWLDGEGAS